MRAPILALVACLAAVPVLAATQSPKQEKPAKAPKVLSLTGCVTRDDSPDGVFIEDADAGKYRIVGRDFREYFGRQVQVAGSVVDSKKLKIAGGLLPSPNIAAQAGAIDPGQAAIATANPAIVNGVGDVPQFKVRSIKPLAGPCSK